MTRKTRKQLKLVAFMLSLMMLLTAFPVIALAEDGEPVDNSATEPIVTDGETPTTEPEATSGTATLTARRAGIYRAE